MNSAERDEPACIQYFGVPGMSKDCQDAILRMVQFGDRITDARLLTAGTDHAFLLTFNEGDMVAIKSGFASGYLGEGPRTFSYVLQVLRSHGAEIDEYDVGPQIIKRIEDSALTVGDLETILFMRPMRPSRWFDYMFERDWDLLREGTLWREFPPVIPFSWMDPRLVDLAISFWEAPDAKLLTAYRRLEDLIRERTGVDEYGSKLFSQVFLGKGAKLTWQNLDDNEQVGRGNLFVATFMAYRNRRSHKEVSDGPDELLGELLSINQLYRLEAQSCVKPASVE